MSSIRRLATKTLLISSCFVVLFVSGFIGSMVAAKEIKPDGSTSIRDAKVARPLFACCSQQSHISGH
jgi:alkaline phosphatase D